MESFGRTSDESLLVGMFTDREDAEKAYEELKDMGYESEEINVIMTAEGHGRHFKEISKESRSEMGNKAMEGTGTGAAIGGITGGIAGLLRRLEQT